MRPRDVLDVAATRLDQEGAMRESANREKLTAGWSCAMLVTVALLAACSSTDHVAQTEEGGVESRAISQMQRPMQPGQAIKLEAAAAQKFQLPTWPQQFDVEDRQPASFGIAVTQPGPLFVDVQWQGPPLEAILRGPSVQPIVQRGKGTIRLAYQVTSQDLQRGMLWVVRVSLLPSSKGRATGQVMVQHPPVNEAQAEAAVRRRVEQAKQHNQLTSAQVQIRKESLLSTRKNEIDRQLQDFLKGSELQVETFLKQKDGQALIRSRGFWQQNPVVMEPDGRAPRLSASPVAPHISKLSVSQGPPGTTVLLEGSGFTDGPGFVHMVVSPTRELIAKVVGATGQPVWADGFIAVRIPELTGVNPFTANLYVSVGVDPSSQVRSNFVPFNFIPRQQVRIVTRVTGDRRLDDKGGTHPSFVKDNTIHHTKLSALIPAFGLSIPFLGTKGNDWFFENTTLTNGWKLDCVEIIPFDLNSCRPGDRTVYAVPTDWAGAYVVAGLGTPSPQFAVRWWLEPFNPGMTYSYAMAISGPEGTPDGIEVP